MLLCLLGYLIPVNLLAARTTLLTAATIAAVGNKYVINSLTETSVTARLVNVAVVSAFAMVLIYMLASVRCERIAAAGHRERAERLNRNVGIGSAVVYVVVMSLVFWRERSCTVTGRSTRLSANPLSASAQRVQDALAAAGVATTIVEYDVPARTSAEAAAVLGCTSRRSPSRWCFARRRARRCW